MKKTSAWRYAGAKVSFPVIGKHEWIIPEGLHKYSN